MLKKAQVDPLPTEDKAFLYKNKFGRFGIYNGSRGRTEGGTHEPPYYNNIHLYITSDEEIKEGDWYVNPISSIIYQREGFFPIQKECRKIVATTNPDLWDRYHDGMILLTTKVAKIPDDFIQAFVREEGNIKEVMLEYAQRVDGLKNIRWDRLKLNSNGTVKIHKVKERLYTREELFNAFCTYWGRGISDQPYNEAELRQAFNKEFPES